MLKVLMPEETPSLNKGEAAILYGIIKSFESLSEPVSLSMFSLDPGIDQRSYPTVRIIDARGIMPAAIMVKTRSLFLKVVDYLLFFLKHSFFLLLRKLIGSYTLRLMKRDVWREYTECELVLMAHDSAFAPLYHSFMAVFFGLLKKRVVIYGASFPAVKRLSSRPKAALYEWMVRTALNRLDLITVRENLSFEYLRGIGVRSPLIQLTADFAFLMQPAHDNRIDEIFVSEGLPKDNPIVGMTVSRNKVRKAYSRDMTFGEKENRFVREMAALADHVTSRLGAMVVFIPHSIVSDEDRDDRILSRLVYDQAANKDSIRVLEKDFAAPELKGLVGRFALCVGTRLHFVVDAVSMMVPSVALSDRADQRMHGILGEMVGLSEWVIDVEDISSERLIGAVDKAWAERSNLIQQLMQVVPEVMQKAKLNGTALRRLMNGQTVAKGGIC